MVKMPKKETIVINYCDECSHIFTGELGIVDLENNKRGWGWDIAKCNIMKRLIAENIEPPISIPDWCPLEDA